MENNRESLKRLIAIEGAELKTPNLAYSYAVIALTPLTGGARSLYDQKYKLVGPLLTVLAILLSNFEFFDGVYIILLQILIIIDLFSVKKWRKEKIEVLTEEIIEEGCYSITAKNKELLNVNLDVVLDKIDKDPYQYLIDQKLNKLSDKDVETALALYNQYKIVGAHKYYLGQKTAFLQTILGILSIASLITTVVTAVVSFMLVPYVNLRQSNMIIQTVDPLFSLPAIMSMLIISLIMFVVLSLWWLKDLHFMERDVLIAKSKLNNIEGYDKDEYTVVHEIETDFIDEDQ